MKAILKEAARLYIESPEAQHGDLEMAGWDAELWWNLFEEARLIVAAGITEDTNA